jgi:endonuclease YncB( thermonuclease family)
MMRRKLSSLLFTILVLAIVGFFQKTNPTIVPKQLPAVTPTPLPLDSQKHVVLGTTDASHPTQTAKVIKVIDGDTIEIEGGKKVRYIGMNTPETHDPRRGVQCFGKEAAAKNKELVEGKEITMVKDVSETDKYKRLLRFVYVDGIFVNDYLVRQGFAFATTYPPDVGFADQFKAAEQEARENNRGLWNSCKE